MTRILILLQSENSYCELFYVKSLTSIKDSFVKHFLISCSNASIRIFFISQQKKEKQCLPSEASFRDKWKAIFFTNLSKPVDGVNGLYSVLLLIHKTSDLPHQSHEMNRTKSISEWKIFFHVKSWRRIDGRRIFLQSLFIAFASGRANLNIARLLSGNREVNWMVFRVSSIIFHRENSKDE